ncbi:MAG: WecB/TagA/CpsF family glycosyltransferase [Candidatus Contendobacter sp.]
MRPLGRHDYRQWRKNRVSHPAGVVEFLFLGQGGVATKSTGWFEAAIPPLRPDSSIRRTAPPCAAPPSRASGRVKCSHPVFQRLGLEWLPRLLQQPRRLWRRMGGFAPIFLWHVLRARATCGRSGC